MITNRLHRPLAVLAALFIATTGARGQATSDESRMDAIKEFAQRYEDAVNLRHVNAINRCIDEKALINRALRGVDIPDVSPREMASEISTTFDWGQSIADGLGQAGHYRLLSITDDAKTPRALFRLVNMDGGLNYHDVELAVRSDGSVQITDAMIHLTGETLSQTMNRMLMGAARAFARGENPMTPTVAALDMMSGLMQQGRFEEVLDHYNTLPAAAKRDKMLMVLRITAAAQVGAAATERACNDFRDAHPDDPCVDLLTLDQLLFSEKWAAAEAAIGRIRAAIGPDPYLDDLTATVCMQDGRLAEARAHAERSMKAEPGLEAPQWTILSLDLLENRHDDVARGLSRLEHEFGYEFADLSTIPEYTAFVQSEAYPAWVATHGASNGETLTQVVEP